MALTFGAAVSDRVADSGTIGLWDENQAFTIAQWQKLSTFTSGRALFQRSASNCQILLTGTTELIARRSLSITNAQQTTSDAGLSTGVWYFIALCYDPTDSQFVRVYRGTLSTAVTECAYAAGGTNGSGTASSNSTFYIGNTSALNLALQGDIAFTGVWLKAMNLGELTDQQFYPHVTSRCVLFSRLGLEGVGTQPDLSGYLNKGTVTGATPSADPSGLTFTGKSKINFLRPSAFRPGKAR